MDVDMLTRLADGLGAGAALLLLLALLGVVRGWWVPGYLYRERATELEAWKQLAIRGTQLAQGAVEVAKK